MKIAFVNRPTDRILSPIQTSIGVCTYGITQSLVAAQNSVLVYGVSDVAGAKELGDDFNHEGVRYRFFSASVYDYILGQLFKRYSKSELGKRLNNGMCPPASSSGWSFPFYGRSVARDLALEKCDIVHVQHAAQYLPTIRAFNPQAKIILHLHAKLFPQHNKQLFLERIRHADLVVSVSHYVTNRLRRDFPQFRDRFQTIYNGIDATEFHREKDYFLTRHRKVKRILFTGAVSPHKGLHILLDAFAEVVRQNPDVRLNIVGPQWPHAIEETFPMNDLELLEKIRPFYKSKYIDFLKQKLSPEIADKVSFTNNMPRKSDAFIDHYYDADIFVSPTIGDEGFGLPVLEAMAAGMPVVASRSGAQVETVQDRKTGLLVDKNDAGQLAAALLQLLNDASLRESMGRAGRQRALSHFTWFHAAKTSLQCYNLLLKGASNYSPVEEITVLAKTSDYEAALPVESTL
jgi:glycosyltransferase involved in cell wall biosynthesis